MTKLDDPVLIKKLEEARKLLSEYFHTVQIVAVAYDGEFSQIHHLGFGDYYSRIGAVQGWVEGQKSQNNEYKKLEARKECERSDDGEEWKNE